MSSPFRPDPVTGKPQHANGGTTRNNEGKPQHGREIGKELDRFNKGGRK